MKEIKKVVVGGTFEALHAGHRALLKRAFELGDVTIGLTSGKMARKAKKRKVKSFSARKKALKIFVKKEFNSLTEIIKIEDKYEFLRRMHQMVLAKIGKTISADKIISADMH